MEDFILLRLIYCLLRLILDIITRELRTTVYVSIRRDRVRSEYCRTPPAVRRGVSHAGEACIVLSDCGAEKSGRSLDPGLVSWRSRSKEIVLMCTVVRQMAREDGLWLRS